VTRFIWDKFSEETIRSLPVERLEDLGLALLDFDTLTDLDNWLHS